MLPKKHNLPKIKTGVTVESWTLAITEDSVPVSISSAEMEFRTTAASDTVVFSPVLGVAANVITVPEFTDIETAALPVGDLVYDILVTLTSGEKIRYLEGELTVEQGVTRP